MSRSGSAVLSSFVLLFCVLFCLPIQLAVNGQALQSGDLATSGGTSQDRPPILVELFTSEGCSSCPPADTFLQRLDESSPMDRAQLVVLSEHVDYWDHDGWKDPHSSALLTERQNAYVHALGLNTPYTPQIIVDGTNELRANDPEQINKLFQHAAAQPKIPVSIDEVTVDAGNPGVFRIRIEADGESDKHNADVYIAVALDHVESQVLHGENAGHHLTHVAVVLQLLKIGKVSRGKSFADTVQLKLDPNTDPANVRVVAFVQEPGPGKLLGVALRKGAGSS
jgi:hypothetical protein